MLQVILLCMSELVNLILYKEVIYRTATYHSLIFLTDAVKFIATPTK